MDLRPVAQLERLLDTQEVSRFEFCRAHHLPHASYAQYAVRPALRALAARDDDAVRRGSAGLGFPAADGGEQRLILARVSRESPVVPTRATRSFDLHAAHESQRGRGFRHRERQWPRPAGSGRRLRRTLRQLQAADDERQHSAEKLIAQLDGLLSETVLAFPPPAFLPRWILGPQAKTSFEGEVVHDRRQADAFICGARSGVGIGVYGIERSPIYDIGDRGPDLCGRCDVAGSAIRNPPMFPLAPCCRYFVRIDYGSVTISERQYLLPIAQVQARESAPA